MNWKHHAVGPTGMMYVIAEVEGGAALLEIVKNRGTVIKEERGFPSVEDAKAYAEECEAARHAEALRRYPPPPTPTAP